MANELKKLNLKLNGAFDFEYYYSGADNLVRSDYALHLHDKIEIIILLSGCVNFMVEGEIYTLTPYDALVIKPNVLHHCVGNPGEPFEFLCGWLSFGSDVFSPLSRLNSPLVRQTDEGELASLSECCRYFCSENSAKNDLEFFSFAARTLAILGKGEAARASSGEKFFAGENAVLSKILKDINLNFAEISTAKQIAERHFISLSTLNRLFIKLLRSSPGAYLRTIKLAAAKNYLLGGADISEAAEKSGYFSESNFIRSFKAAFGYTPGEYKKNYERV